MGSLPHFLTHGVPLQIFFARESSANTSSSSSMSELFLKADTRLESPFAG